MIAPEDLYLSRFFRGALFLIVIVLLVYLASRACSAVRGAGEVDLQPADQRGRGEPGDLQGGRVPSKRRSIEATRTVNASRSSGQLSERSIEDRVPEPPAGGRCRSTRRLPAKGYRWSILTYLLPFVLFFGFWIFLMNQVQGGDSKVMSFGKSRAKRMAPDSPKITFKDVAGVDEAVEELHEIKEFLENPKKFQALGARIPKGVLLYGPPGTSRRCSRARSPARPACRSSPSPAPTSSRCSSASAPRACATSSSRPSRPACIIFMDEIDAVGRHRGAGLGGGHDEREQTLNQLLVEMDGFEMKDNIILIAATNRPTSSTRRYSGPGASTGRSSSIAPTETAAARSSRCTRRASRSTTRSTSTRSPPGRPGSPGPISPAS